MYRNTPAVLVLVATVRASSARRRPARQPHNQPRPGATTAPNSPQHWTISSRIGSITKTFVATVVLQLVGEGRLTLDEPVDRRLPGVLALGHQITVRQLLNHTGGLPDYTDDPDLFAGIVQNRVWDPRELVAMAETHPQLFEPGSAYGYSNTDYIVAAC